MGKGSIVVFGKAYQNIDEAYRVINPPMSLRAIKYRIEKAGWDVDRAFSETDAKYAGKEITLFGVTYRSLKEAYMYLEPPISMEGIRTRLKKGMNAEEAFSQPKIKGDSHINAFGKSYRSMSEAYIDARTEVSMATVLKRIMQGATIEEALRSPKRETIRDAIRKEAGVDNLSLREYHRFEQRIASGKPVKEAIKEKETYKYKGKSYKYLSEVVRASGNNICVETVRKRLGLGMSLEDAVETAPGDVGVAIIHKGPVVIYGKQYRSLMSAYQKIQPSGLSYDRIRRRIKSGCSLEEAFEGAERKIEHAGKMYYSYGELYTELARRPGEWASYNIFMQRMMRGKDAEAAMTPVKPKSPK